MASKKIAYLPAEFRDFSPKLSQEEIQLVIKSKYTPARILERRKVIEREKDKAREKAFQLASEEAAVVKMRNTTQTSPEELLKISKEFIERTAGEEVSIKYLAQKYRIFPMDLERYAQAKEWTRKRHAFQVKSRQSSGFREIEKSAAEAQGGEIITKMERDASEAMTASEQMNRSQRSTDRLIQIGRGRYKVAKALRITDEDVAIYKQNPKEIITDIDNIITDPIATKNLVSLVSAFKTLVELERDEDGWMPKRGKDGGLSQVEEEAREILEVDFFNMPEVKRNAQKIVSGAISGDDSVFTE